MITVAPEKDKQFLEELFVKNGLTAGEHSSATVARCDGIILGFCLYDLCESDKRKLVVHKLCFGEDIALADGILRSVLYLAAQRNISDAFYSDTADKAVFERLGFVKSAEEKRLDIDKLFGGCHCNK